MTQRDVMEFGEDLPRRSMLSGMLNRLGGGTPTRDRRVLLGIAGLGGILVLLSMLQEWQVTRMADGDGEGQSLSFTTYVGGLGAWGSAYVMGVFGLAAVTVVVLFGQRSIRSVARLAGLGAAGTLVGLLVATFVNLGESSAVFSFSAFSSASPPDYDVSYGSGMFLAFLGVGATAAALFLTDRPRFGQDHEDELVAESEEDDEPVAVTPAPRPRPAYPQPVASGPVDLTVSPATPFMHMPESYHDR